MLYVISSISFSPNYHSPGLSRNIPPPGVSELQNLSQQPLPLPQPWCSCVGSVLAGETVVS